jgi:tetratricopeptide (TPR) repeat protein
VNLAILAYNQGDLPAARAHVRESLRLDPRQIDALTLLGSILLAENKTPEALRQFAAVNEMAPGNLQVGTAYASALMRNGDSEAAGEVVRRLLEGFPEQAGLYPMLAQSRKLQEGDEDLTLIRSLLDPQGRLRPEFDAEPGLRIPAYMALHKMESDLGHWEAAFRYLEAAKDDRKALFPFDVEVARQRHRLLSEIFDAEFLAARAGQGCAARDPIFVVGMPRSGTTLLERLLASLDSVAAAGELPFVQRVMQGACARYGSGQADLTALRKLPPEAWRELGEEYVRRARRRVPDGRHFVDKLPANYAAIGFIKTMLPQARIIHLRRHPVSTCLSIYEQDFVGAHPYSNDLRWLGQYYLLYRELMEHWRCLLESDLIELDYETLVADPDRTLERLARTLGLEPPAGEPEQPAGQIITASLWQARQPVHADSVARWKHYEKQLSPLLETLAPILD